VKLTGVVIWESEVKNCIVVTLPTWQNKSVSHFLIIEKKKKKQNEINKRRETRKRREFESLYLVCYEEEEEEEDKYDDLGLPKAAKMF
jgi:hypothetical protein